jgi:hypothetical protein
VVTLDRNGRKALLALATLPDPGKVMKMDMGPETTRVPGLVVEGCFVRGDGDLVWGRASRPCELDVRKSLVVLTGSLLNVEAGKEVPASAGPMVASLKQVTTCLQGHLLRVRAGKDLKGLLPIRFRPDECLFLPAAPASDRVLVHLEGPESEESALRGKLAWEGGRNAYGNFNALLDFQAPEDGKMPQMHSLDWWKSWSNETASYYGARLATPPAIDTTFAQVMPTQFKPGDDVPAQRGADLSSLPRPRTP